LSISNTGPGIPTEKLSRVFDQFYRGDASHNSAVEGCGLGLSIVQSIAKAHNGEVTIQSTPMEWTTATIKLPIVGTLGGNTSGARAVMQRRGSATPTCCRENP
jgi:signal transduction histidine kinase